MFFTQGSQGHKRLITPIRLGGKGSRDRRRQRPGCGHRGEGCPCPRCGRPRDRNRRRPRIRRALGKTRASDLTIARQASACGPLPSSCAACGLRGNAWGRAAPAPGSGGKGLEARTEQGRPWAQQETYTTGLREGWPRARATAPPRHRKGGQGCGSCPTHKWSRRGV